MTLTILDDSISSDHTMHTARLAPGHEHAWHASWLPGRLMDRNTAITAMMLADVVAPGDLHAGHPTWLHTESWAAELGLTAPDTLAWVSQPPGSVSIERDAAVSDDPEAASS
jgi:hypothetical protein